MKLLWTELAWEEYVFWQTTDKKILERINTLIESIQRTPFAGIGKPEGLRFELTGKWSRRINDVHRLVYAVSGKKEKEKNKTVDCRVLTIYQCKYHY